MRFRDRVTVLLLVAAAFGIVLARVVRHRDRGGTPLPRREYELLIDMKLYGHGREANVRAALPPENDRQRVRNEMVSSGDFRFDIERDALNRTAVWNARSAHGPKSLVYSCTVATKAQRFDLEPGIELPDRYPSELRPYLLGNERIQADSHEILSLLNDLVPPDARHDVNAIIRAIYDYTNRTIKPANYKGTTDALTCLRLGESSCGGKSRLFVALARAAGIPARTVGGLILKESTWQSTHVWAEAWIGGYWVPFCPLNGHFAEIPGDYLVTYYGDLPQFVHTPDVNFTYGFTAKRILAPPTEWLPVSIPASLTALNLWAAFEHVRIPVDLLKIILMLPFGALVVVICRNVIGIETFGTFMPTLMAVAFRDTGLWWGTLLFVAILLVGSLARAALARFQLLHTPRLAVILTVTVLFVLFVALVGAATGSVLATRVSLFPLAILTLTVERFAGMLEEYGARRTTIVVAGTLAVVALCYTVMEWEALQVATLAFPEVLLLVIAAFFVVGRWLGMRLSEYLRFRELLTPARRA